MSCDATASQPGRRGRWALSVLALAGLCAVVVLPTSRLDHPFVAGSGSQLAGARTAAQSSPLSRAQPSDGGPPAGLPAGPALTGSTRGVPFNGTGAVGALFIDTAGRLVRHFCTASVVHSPQLNLLITAAHCMTGKRLTPPGRIEFAPQYHSGKFPFGLWPVSAIYQDTKWLSRHDPDDDVAFLVVRRPGWHIERHTGAEKLLVNTRPPELTRVIGYPDSKEQPVSCTATARAFGTGSLTQLVFRCADYTNGTSGGPFLTQVSRRTGDGSVIGVIGGYQYGGYSPNVSYSPRFLNNVAALYKTATSGRS